MRTVEGGQLSAKELALIEPDEAATFAARPSAATVGTGAHWDNPLLLLTDRRLVISKERFLGKRKADFAIDWSGVETVSGEPGGSQIRLTVRTVRGNVELSVRPQHAVEVESAIRTGYLD